MAGCQESQSVRLQKHFVVVVVFQKEVSSLIIFSCLIKICLFWYVMCCPLQNWLNKGVSRHCSAVFVTQEDGKKIFESFFVLRFRHLRVEL